MSQVTGVKITKPEVKGLGRYSLLRLLSRGLEVGLGERPPQSWVRHTHNHSFPIGIAFLEMEALFLIFTVR